MASNQVHHEIVLTTEQVYELFNWFVKLEKPFPLTAQLVLFRRSLPITLQLVAMYDGKELILEDID